MSGPKTIREVFDTYRSSGTQEPEDVFPQGHTLDWRWWLTNSYSDLPTRFLHEATFHANCPDPTSGTTPATPPHKPHT